MAGIFGLVDMWGHISRAYVTLPEIDIVTHILFGAWLALFLIHKNKPESRLGIFLLVMLVGVGWEGLEFTYDHLYALPHAITSAQHGIFDTAKDVLNNAIGALASLFIFRTSAENSIRISHPNLNTEPAQ